jgi:hypothetical protein
VVKLLLRNTNLNITKKRQRYYTESLWSKAREKAVVTSGTEDGLEPVYFNK